MHRRRLACLLAVALLAIGCAGSSGQLSASVPPGAIVSELDGVFLLIDVQPKAVGAGHHPTFLAELRNERSTPIELTFGGCDFAGLRLSIPVPWEPTGRTWQGRAGWFKDYALTHAYGPGAVAAFSPIDATLLSSGCEGPGPDLLGPGETLKADFTPAIDSFMTTYSYVSTIPFSITVDLDRQNSPPPRDPNSAAIPQHWFPEYRHLTGGGEITIDGLPAAVLTAGQAVDGLLDDGRFTTWLDRQDLATCQTANLFLESGWPPDTGAAWYVQLFCETEVERHIGSAQVDAASGEVRHLRLCDESCD
jgi:hypothetical protein